MIELRIARGGGRIALLVLGKRQQFAADDRTVFLPEGSGKRLLNHKIMQDILNYLFFFMNVKGQVLFLKQIEFIGDMTV